MTSAFENEKLKPLFKEISDCFDDGTMHCELHLLQFHKDCQRIFLFQIDISGKIEGCQFNISATDISQITALYRVINAPRRNQRANP